MLLAGFCARCLAVLGAGTLARVLRPSLSLKEMPQPPPVTPLFHSAAMAPASPEMPRLYALRPRCADGANSGGGEGSLMWQSQRPHKLARGKYSAFQVGFSRTFSGSSNFPAMRSVSGGGPTSDSYVSRLRPRSRPRLSSSSSTSTRSDSSAAGRENRLKRMRSRPSAVRHPAPSWHTGMRSNWTAAAVLASSAAMAFSVAGSEILTEQQEGHREPGGGEGLDVGSGSRKRSRRDYQVIKMPGDGRCLFHAVTHGACLRSGLPLPQPSQQRSMADELRHKVVDEFIKRRDESEWFIEGNFDTYMRNMRKPHAWGGEPELLMMSHVLRAPITVYIADPKQGGSIISIAEYGQEYKGKGDPIAVLYNGSSHYDALQFNPDGHISRL